MNTVFDAASGISGYWISALAIFLLLVSGEENALGAERAAGLSSCSWTSSVG